MPNKKGRPPKKAAERLEVKKSIRFTKDELKSIINATSSAKMTPAEFMREAVLEKVIVHEAIKKAEGSNELFDMDAIPRNKVNSTQ